MKNIRISNIHFVDDSKTKDLLRGVNLAGSSKVPFTPRITTSHPGLYEEGDVSFVGRPFPLNEADIHFKRLKDWGFRFLRLLITWEAIEHKGPGVYDDEYIDYISEVCKLAGEYGFDLFVDPHQDVWSRYSGGDGAPLWTLEKVGFDVRNFNNSLAAIVQNTYQGKYPKMVWPANYKKLAAATMFTLFFAGRDFAPDLKIDGVQVQDFLQDHYINAVARVAQKLKDLPNVVGFDTMNEPSCGFIGVNDLNAATDFYKMGFCPSAFQSMILGEGISQKVPRYNFEQVVDVQEVNISKKRAWKSNFECIWKQQKVWDFINDEPVILKPGYFATAQGKPVNFLKDYFKPFATKFCNAVQKINPEYIIFLETIVENRELPQWDEHDPGNIVNADHWYDEFTLITKTFQEKDVYQHRNKKMLTSAAMIESEFENEVGERKRSGDKFGHGVPTLIGEFGIPFDLDDKKAYKTGDFTAQIKALDRSFRAIEKNIVSCTLWNYSPDNTHRYGDNWNDEDLSIFSQDDQIGPDNIHSGGRAAEAFARPYPYKIPGDLRSYTFKISDKSFEMEFILDNTIQFPLEIIVPKCNYPNGFYVDISNGNYRYIENEQLLICSFQKTANQIIKVKVSPK